MGAATRAITTGCPLGMLLGTAGDQRGNASASAISEVGDSLAWQVGTGYAVTGAISLALG